MQQQEVQFTANNFNWSACDTKVDYEHCVSIQQQELVVDAFLGASGASYEESVEV